MGGGSGGRGVEGVVGGLVVGCRWWWGREVSCGKGVGSGRRVGGLVVGCIWWRGWGVSGGRGVGS